jgi:hypothetical protein
MSASPTNLQSINTFFDPDANTVTVVFTLHNEPAVEIVLDNSAAWHLGDLLHHASVRLDDYRAKPEVNLLVAGA